MEAVWLSTTNPTKRRLNIFKHIILLMWFFFGKKKIADKTMWAICYACYFKSHNLHDFKSQLLNLLTKNNHENTVVLVKLLKYFSCSTYNKQGRRKSTTMLKVELLTETRLTQKDNVKKQIIKTLWNIKSIRLK